MSTPFNNRLRKAFEAKNKEKEEEKKNKGEIPVNPEDSETKRNTITSVNYSIIEDSKPKPEPKTKEVVKPTSKDSRQSEKKVENRINFDGQNLLARRAAFQKAIMQGTTGDLRQDYRKALFDALLNP